MREHKLYGFGEGVLRWTFDALRHTRPGTRYIAGTLAIMCHATVAGQAMTQLPMILGSGFIRSARPLPWAPQMSKGVRSVKRTLFDYQHAYAFKVIRGQTRIIQPQEVPILDDVETILWDVFHVRLHRRCQ